jgi:hypothetical protein
MRFYRCREHGCSATIRLDLADIQPQLGISAELFRPLIDHAVKLFLGSQLAPVAARYQPINLILIEQSGFARSRH